MEVCRWNGRYGLFSGAVGGTTPLTSLTANGATITQSSTVQTTGAVSYTAGTLINLGGNVTTSGGAVSMTGPTALTANAIVDTTNAGGTAAGANITFSNTLNGAHTLSLIGGTGGTVLLSGAVGGTTPLTSLTANAAMVTQSSVEDDRGCEETGSTGVNLGGNVTTSGGTIGFTGPVALTAASIVDATNAGATLPVLISVFITL